VASSAASRTGIANLPLHGGKAPPWLFQRMVNLSREITIFIVSESGPEEMLRRMSDPCWFQAFGCVLGFDWHSSGVTTTLCGALKEGLRELQEELGLFVAGGKGRTSRRTPADIESHGSAISVHPSHLIYASKMSAKVDNTALQDGYQLYHHSFLFTKRGSWAVVQQGMNEGNRYARRYHWLGESVADFVCEPHAAICSQGRGDVLNLVAGESATARSTITSIGSEQTDHILRDITKIKTLNLPPRHHIALEDIHPDRLTKGFTAIYERQPKGFEELLSIEGVGPKTVRALSLISELVYGAPASFRDPARYSFAHGGKDGHPFPVDRQTYDESIQLLARAVHKARIASTEKSKALSRLSKGFEP
jgi:hypothetical protein